MNAYFRLMRMDKPAGFWLLWAPTAWALVLAHPKVAVLSVWLKFLAGTWLMRTAGCIINDLADRHIDPRVARTKQRPLASGELSAARAMWVLMGLLAIALSIVLTLPTVCWVEAVMALALSILYPFCKRFLDAPQLILGLAFSMGIPMAYSASNHAFDLCMWLLLVLNMAWIIAYDTMYALVDKVDDLRIGVHSTAIWFGQYAFFILRALQIVVQSLWLVIAYLQSYSWIFYATWCVGTGLFVYQQVLLRHPSTYMRAFLNNGWYGMVMWLGLF